MVRHLQRGLLTHESKWKIVMLMKEHGNPNKVAESIPCQVRTVLKWWSVYKQCGSVDVTRNRWGKMGRPIKWSTGVLTDLKKLLESKDVCYASEIKALRWKRIEKVPTRSLNRLLVEKLGAAIKKKTRCQLITDSQKARRVAFATAHLNDDISKTVFTDESMFEVAFSKGKRRCLPGQAPGPSNEVKFPPKVHVWGAISLCGTFQIHILTDYVNAETYIATLSKFFADLPIDAPGVRCTQVTLQQDGARAHTSKAVAEWLKRKKISVLDSWPANSPDLNPIEPIWAWMKEEIRKMMPGTVDDLAAAIQEVWGRVPPKVIEGCINGYPKHLAECILRDGAKTGH